MDERIRAYVVICFAFFRFSFFFRSCFHSADRWSAWMTLEMFNLLAFIIWTVFWITTKWQLVSETEWINRNIDLLPTHGNFRLKKNKVHWTKLHARSDTNTLMATISSVAIKCVYFDHTGDGCIKLSMEFVFLYIADEVPSQSPWLTWAITEVV